MPFIDKAAAAFTAFAIAIGGAVVEAQQAPPRVRPGGSRTATPVTRAPVPAPAEAQAVVPAPPPAEVKPTIKGEATIIKVNLDILTNDMIDHPDTPSAAATGAPAAPGAADKVTGEVKKRGGILGGIGTTLSKGGDKISNIKRDDKGGKSASIEDQAWARSSSYVDRISQEAAKEGKLVVKIWGNEKEAQELISQPGAVGDKVVYIIINPKENKHEAQYKPTYDLYTLANRALTQDEKGRAGKVTLVSIHKGSDKPVFTNVPGAVDAIKKALGIPVASNEIAHEGDIAGRMSVEEVLEFGSVDIGTPNDERTFGL